MKKLISFTLCFGILFLAMLPYSFAENKENETKELIFRGIPFGATFSEVQELLHVWLGDRIIDNGYIQETTSGADKINVAGYDMMLELSYRWEDAKNDSRDDSVFMSAEYRYYKIFRDDVDIPTCAEDLARKLVELYGEYSVDESGDYPYYKYIWDNFSNNAELVLQVKDTENKAHGVVSITYTSKDEVERWNSIKQEYQLIQNEILSNNYDGL